MKTLSSIMKRNTIAFSNFAKLKSTNSSQLKILKKHFFERLFEQ
jgi:hypothetical protein